MLIQANHFQGDRLITNLVECDILDAQFSSLSVRGLYFSLEVLLHLPIFG